MTHYKIEHKISTLIENAVNAAEVEPSFEIEGIIFTHWGFNHRDGWVGQAWIATYEVDAESAFLALQKFRKRLFKIVPVISLVGQAYIQYLVQPFLITRRGSDVAYLYYSFDSGPVGLMFQEDDEKALKLLLANQHIPEEFYLYWNDAVNTVGYSSKLLIMFAALEALTRDPKGKKDISLQEKILGKKLSDAIYHPTTGLRHRLSHGNYFSEGDTGNYVSKVHKKVVKYFNDIVLGEKLIEENIVDPQRHFFNNDLLLKVFIRQTDPDWPLTLMKVTESCEIPENDHFPNQYETIHDDAITKVF